MLLVSFMLDIDAFLEHLVFSDAQIFNSCFVWIQKIQPDGTDFSHKSPLNGPQDNVSLQ